MTMQGTERNCFRYRHDSRVFQTELQEHVMRGLVALAIAAWTLAACTASLPEMTQGRVCPACQMQTNQFYKAIELGVVKLAVPRGATGRGLIVPYLTDETLREALRQSFVNNELLADETSQRRYVLDAYLIVLENPGHILVNVYSVIRYTIREKETGTLVLDETVDAVPTKGSRFTIETSIKTNIGKLISLVLRDSKSGSPKTGQGGSRAQ